MKLFTRKPLRLKVKLILLTALLISVSGIAIFTASVTNSSTSSRDIVIGFFTYNDYGNNLYIDNVRTGTQIANDVKVTALVNIPYDTVYSVYLSGTDTITPIVGVSNIGLFPTSDSVPVYLKIDPIGYFDSTRVAPMSAGQSLAAVFERLTYPIGTALYITAFSGYISDSNRVNDTLRQYSIALPGYRRSVLFEEFTSNSSPSCANNNSFLNQFINQNFDNVCAIKYHLGVLGTDSFYFANPVQTDARKRFYFVNSVPYTLADGKLQVSIPYGDSTNLYSPFRRRYDVGSPLQISVVNEDLGSGQIRATATITIATPLKPGDYRLRFNAVERYRYDTLQGSNGESNFYDIFRAVYPDTNGIAISTSTGINQYSVTYSIQPGWIDSMIYTCAFVQNDYGRDVINSGKSRSEVLRTKYDSPSNTSNKADLFEPGKSVRSQTSGSDSISSNLIVELFESYFPPLGWRIYDEDGFITYEQNSLANGPSIGGVKSVYMRFYDYTNRGEMDTMISTSYSNLLSTDSIRFDYAYALYSASNRDSLIVKLSSDGGQTFPVEIFRRGGLGLSTAPQTSSFFIPQNFAQWRTFAFPLNSVVSLQNSAEQIPGSYRLYQNFPNPFNPSTTISFSMPVRSHVKLVIYDLLGREIHKLADAQYDAGEHSIRFENASLPSGIYFCRLESPGYSSVIKMALTK